MRKKIIRKLAKLHPSDQIGLFGSQGSLLLYKDIVWMEMELVGKGWVALSVARR